MTALDRAQSRWQASKATQAGDASRAGLLRLLKAVDDLPTDPPALMGLDDLDPDVLAELLPARARLNGDER